MFSRRHPYLFFILIFTAIIMTGTVIVSFLTSGVAGRSGSRFGPKVGVIGIKGVIFDSRDVLKDLKRFREDSAIKAIVLRINSPGGAVGPSQEIYREVRKTIKYKPVIVSMGAVAASGGYYIASAADGIVADPGTITGSIGVIMEYTNFRDLFQKIGLYPVVIKSGKYKDIGSPLRKMTPAEKALLQHFVDSVHQQFIDAVAVGRHMKKSAVEKIADGRIFCGANAKKLGLVDRLGNFEDAVDWAGRMGGIKGKIETVYPPEKRPTLVRYLLDQTLSQVHTWLDQMTVNSLGVGYIFDPAGSH